MLVVSSHQARGVITAYLDLTVNLLVREIRAEGANYPRSRGAYTIRIISCRCYEY